MKETDAYINIKHKETYVCEHKHSGICERDRCIQKDFVISLALFFNTQGVSISTKVRVLNAYQVVIRLANNDSICTSIL